MFCRLVLSEGTGLCTSATVTVLSDDAVYVSGGLSDGRSALHPWLASETTEVGPRASLLLDSTDFEVSKDA